MPKLVGVFGLVAIVILSISSVGEPDEDVLRIASDELGIPEDELLENAERISFLDSFNEPDYTVNGIQITETVEEVELVSKAMELTRTLTFNDGTTDEEIISSTSLVPIPSLNFITPTSELRPIGEGSVNFKIGMTIDEDKEVREIAGQFSILYNDVVVKTVPVNTIEKENPVLIDTKVDIKPLMATSPDGVHDLEIQLDSLYIVYDDFSREYANPDEILYTLSFEKDSTQTLTLNEEGNFEKSFDFDVPINVYTKRTSFNGKYCYASYVGGGGCAISFTFVGAIPNPPMGSVTITDLKTGEIVAQSPPVSQGGCGANHSKVLVGPSGCIRPTGGGGLSFNAQRGESYQISVSDPARTWSVDIPEIGGSFSWSCSGSPRTCNFP